MRLHLETNNLRPADVPCGDAQHENVLTRIFNGAVWTHDGEIWFPTSDVTDMGTAATSSNSAIDYRGEKCANQAIPCKRLDTLLQDLGKIDFMHIDIQGAEVELLEDQIDWVTNNVSALMIATHSRSIEGKLVDLLLTNGWQMHREKPCRVDWGRDCSLPGRTIVDGSQYWLNDNFR